MTTLLLPDPQFFNYRDCLIGGDECVLIFPSELQVDWTVETLCYRSIILRKSDHKVISIGQLKFTNLGEKPHLYPEPTLDGAVAWDKLDGSLICVSRHNGQLICRTRGTTTVMVHPDGQDVLDLVTRYGVDQHPLLDGHSLLFEHLSVTRPIVLRYSEPDLVLLDIVRHSDLRYLSVAEVDAVANQLGCKRPERFTFDSVNDIVQTCLHLKGKEGFVLAYNGNQHRVKIKANAYLVLHRLKSELGSLSKVLDLYMAHLEGEPAREAAGLHGQTLHDYVAKTFDYEIAEQVKPFIERIQDAHALVGETVRSVGIEVALLDGLSRKDAALSIIARYREAGLSGLAFILLDKRPVPSKTLRDLIERQLEATT